MGGKFVSECKVNGLILGLGNELLCDDAIGIRLAKRLAGTLHADGWEVDWGEIGPLETMERLVGRDAAILIDSIRIPGDPPGSVYEFASDQLGRTEHARWSHGIDLATALKLGRDQGFRLPTHLHVMAINVTDVFTLSEVMTPEMEEAFDRILREVDRHIRRLIGEVNASSSGEL